MLPMLLEFRSRLIVKSFDLIFILTAIIRAPRLDI